jgi:short-subunit dehydrogenase
LILVARSEERLRELAQALSMEHGVHIQVITADLALPNSAAAVYAETEGLGVEVDLLINNAGFAKAGSFAELPFDVQAQMVRLNVNTLMELTHLYLAGMRQRGRGGIINLSSTASFQPVPSMAVYGATKAFVLSFSEAVAEEVAADGVTVMALCPGATATDFWAAAGLWADRLHSMTAADEVVAEALSAFKRRKYSYVPGFRNRLLALGARLGPRRMVLRAAASRLGSRP